MVTHRFDTLPVGTQFHYNGSLWLKLDLDAAQCVKPDDPKQGRVHYICGSVVVEAAPATHKESKMAGSIYKKIDADSCGNTETMHAYAAYLRQELAAAYPDAAITIETTERESGVMPTSIEAESYAEEQSITAYIDSTWGEFCRRQ